MAKIHYPANLKIKSVEEYSEAKVYKSNPELWNNNGNAYYFYLSVEVFESVASCKEFVDDKPQINQHGKANARWYLCFQLRILHVHVTQMYLKISSYV